MLQKNRMVCYTLQAQSSKSAHVGLKFSKTRLFQCGSAAVYRDL